MQTKHWERRGELRVYLSKSRVEEEKKTILFMAQKHKRSPRQATKLPTLDSSSGSVSSCPLRQLQQLANSCQYLKYAKAAISREREGERARRAEEAGKGSRAWSSSKWQCQVMDATATLTGHASFGAVSYR